MILGTMALSSCLSHKHKSDDIICTTEYRMLVVSIKDSLLKPVTLDSYFVKKASTGEIIDFVQEDPYFDSINRPLGIYLLFTDGKMNMTTVRGSDFEFHGFLDSVEIVNENYVIGNDRCHVVMHEGRQEIVINE